MKHDARPGQEGMSLVEMGVVVLIIGLMAGLGVYSVRQMMENARVNRTRSLLTQVKDCLEKRAVFNNRYPSHETGVIRCDKLTYDVNACLCRGEIVRDAWDTELRYIDGIEAPGSSLAGKPLLSETPPAPNSEIIDASGRKVGDVAFLIISYGDNRVADHPSYDGPPLQTLNHAAPPDFSGKNDDVYLLVTANELRASMAE